VVLLHAAGVPKMTERTSISSSSEKDGIISPMLKSGCLLDWYICRSPLRRNGTNPAAFLRSGPSAGSMTRACQILPLPSCRYRFKFQSNLVWDSIKSISNFYFQFSKTI
jgi:hypothetical protein